MMDPTDCQLIERFVRQRDEAAFSTLTRRHAALVLGVCRRVLGDEHEAEDIFQATFLVLARKATGLPCQNSVGPWLSAVAHRLALHARSTRYRCREHPAGLLLGNGEGGPEPAFSGSDPAAAAAQKELSGLVGEELAGLPEKYRAPVVLCYLEGKSNEQAARELGWPAGSMSRRLEKARQLLRERLTGRGVALLTLVLCLALTGFWLARLALPALSPPVSVAEAMSCFKPTHAHEPGLEAYLRHLAEESPATIDPKRTTALAAEAVRVADRMEPVDPGRRRSEWQRLARDMGLAGQRLAEANDQPATLLAAARLHTACVRCHETFRD